MANGYFYNPIRLNTNEPQSGLLGSVRVSPLDYSSLSTTPAISPLAVSGQDRASAFLKGLGQLGAGLLAAGAPTTAPGQFAKGIAQGGQGFSQAFDQSLNQSRQRNVQDLNLQMAQATQRMAAAKAAREKQLFDIEMQRRQRLNNLLGIPSQNQSTPSVPVSSSVLRNASQANDPVVASASNQSQVQIGDVAVPRSVVATALLTKNPGEEISKFVQKTVGAANKFTPLGELTPEGRDSHERSLRDSLKNPLKEITSLATKGNAINAALDRDSGLGDLAAINSYQRLIDPAVVRGEDVELIANAKPIGEYFETFKEKLRAGKTLGPNQRKELRGAARDFIAAKNKGFVLRLTNVKNLAIKDKLRWDRIWLGPSIDALSGVISKKKSNQKGTSLIPSVLGQLPKIKKKKRLRSTLKPRISGSD